MLAEEHIVRQLLKLLEGDVTYHPTPCDGLRTCDKECDDPFWTLQRNGTGSACKEMCATSSIRTVLLPSSNQST